MAGKDKKAVVRFCRTNETGNIFHIVSSAVRALNNTGKQEQARTLKTRVWEADDYEKALKVIGEYVTLIEEK